MSLPLPENLIESLEGTTGFDRSSFMEAHENQSPNISIRYNTQKISAYKGALPDPLTRISWSPYGYYLQQRPSFTHDPLFHGGLYYVQEPGSQFLWEVIRQTASANKRLKILDLCAAPGGKSTLLASYFKNSLVVSNEIMKNRAAILTENATKWGSGNIVVTSNDPTHFQRLKGFFDIIVIDAPCSGSGLFRKDQVAVEQWTPELVSLCSKRQEKILRDSLPALKQDGLIIYSTCSYSVAEDEHIMDYMAGQMGLSSVPLSDIAKGITEVRGRVKDNNGKHASGYKFFPDKVRSEGFFITVFKKQYPELPGFHPGDQISPVGLKEQAIVDNWIKPHQDLFFMKQGNEILALENKWVQDLAVLQKNLFLKKAGVKIGQIKGKDLVPAHDLAVSCWVSDQVPRQPLDRAQSLQYLKSQEPAIELENTAPGWHLATFEGIGLGWMKILPNRVNNYYPRNWRILKA